MLTRHAITQRADADGVDAAVAERDYVLAHVIAQLHHAVPADGGRLVFKDGTALRFTTSLTTVTQPISISRSPVEVTGQRSTLLANP
jgi:hypothetical protein